MWLFVAITLTNVVVMATLPVEFADLLNRPMAAIHSIISTRIVLNLREVLGNSSEVLSGGQTFSHDIVHSLRFAERELEMSVDGHAIEDGRRSRSVLELSPRNSGNKEQERLQAKEEIHAADFP
jgi:hypothetical protein